MVQHKSIWVQYCTYGILTYTPYCTFHVRGILCWYFMLCVYEIRVCTRNYWMLLSKAWNNYFSTSTHIIILHWSKRKFRMHWSNYGWHVSNSKIPHSSSQFFKGTNRLCRKTRVRDDHCSLDIGRVYTDQWAILIIEEQSRYYAFVFSFSAPELVLCLIRCQYLKYRQFLFERRRDDRTRFKIAQKGGFTLQRPLWTSDYDSG